MTLRRSTSLFLLRGASALALALALLAAPGAASAQTVTVQGEVQYGNPPQGYGNPPPGYGQQQPQQQPYYAPTYQQPAPQVRYVDRETNIKALWIPGIIVFGVSYGLSAAFGSIPGGDYSIWMYIPVIGPWAALGYANNDDEITGSLIGGLTQLGGLTMFILGLTLTRTVRVAVYSLDESDERAPTLALDALPAPGGGQIGLTLSHF